MYRSVWNSTPGNYNFEHFPKINIMVSFWPVYLFLIVNSCLAITAQHESDLLDQNEKSLSSVNGNDTDRRGKREYKYKNINNINTTEFEYIYEAILVWYSFFHFQCSRYFRLLNSRTRLVEAHSHCQTRKYNYHYSNISKLKLSLLFDIASMLQLIL